MGSADLRWQRMKCLQICERAVVVYQISDRAIRGRLGTTFLRDLYDVDVGGITVRVERGDKPDWYEDAIAFNKGDRYIGWAISRERLRKLNIHASEYSSVGLNYDHYIDNNGTIDDLHAQVKSIVNL